MSFWLSGKPSSSQSLSVKFNAPSALYWGVHDALTAPVATHKLSFQQSMRRTLAWGGPLGLLPRGGMLSAVGLGIHVTTPPMRLASQARPWGSPFKNATSWMRT